MKITIEIELQPNMEQLLIDEINEFCQDWFRKKPILYKTDVSGSLPRSTETYMLLVGGRTLITGTFDECKDYADKLVKPVGAKLNIVNVVWRQ